MSARARQVELLLLSMFAAVPLYGTQTISTFPLLAYHLVIAGITARVISNRSPQLIPEPVMRGLGIAYVFFYVIDAALISRSAISASTHLVLFIAAYQAIEPSSTRAAGFYLAGTTVIGVLMFPILPRVRNPIVPGLLGSIKSASTGLSDTINFNEQRTITPDATVVSRIWMTQEAIPFFT